MLVDLRPGRPDPLGARGDLEQRLARVKGYHDVISSIHGQIGEFWSGPRTDTLRGREGSDWGISCRSSPSSSTRCSISSRSSPPTPEVRGYPPYDPRLMSSCWSTATSPACARHGRSRESCQRLGAVRFLAANQAPDFRSIAGFRQRHLQALRGLFLESLELCQQAGMVRLGRVALDGTKRRANASRRKP